jgi:APA family basic amino acid/polyamine antiporter
LLDKHGWLLLQAFTVGLISVMVMIGTICIFLGMSKDGLILLFQKLILYLVHQTNLMILGGFIATVAALHRLVKLAEMCSFGTLFRLQWFVYKGWILRIKQPGLETNFKVPVSTSNCCLWYTNIYLMTQPV